jgi:periplasmic protein TonB
VTTLMFGVDEPEESSELPLWVTAAIVVAAIHIALAVAYLRFKPEPEARAEAPVIDVAFMPATPEPAAPPSVDQPDPAPTRMDQPQELPKEPPPIPEPEQQPPPAQVEAMVPAEPPPPAPVPLVAVQPELAPPPAVPEQTAAIPPPTDVAPVPEKRVTVPEPAPRKVAPVEKVEKRQAPPKAAVSPATKPMRVATAPNPGAESEGARVGRESWASAFAAQIRRWATYPPGSRDSGTAQVSVTVARNGRLVSRHLASSSGSAVLDQAAMAIIERAQPFQPFPASMPEAQITKLVPLHLRPQ